MSKENKKHEVVKPDVLYKSKTLKIYSNPEAASEAESSYSANQSPLDRIRETVQLILRVYSTSEKTSASNKIFIDKT